MKKTLITILATILVFGCAVGTTFAWLMDKTDPVVNTFTVGDIDITLEETGTTDNAKSFKMVPGQEIEKDPIVTVLKDSEACWLIVKLAKSANANNFLTIEVADGWDVVDAAEGVYAREVAASDADQEFQVLKDNKVTVKDTVKKSAMDTLDASTYPTLTVTAYAVQKEAAASASAAWALAQNDANY